MTAIDEIKDTMNALAEQMVRDVVFHRQPFPARKMFEHGVIEPLRFAYGMFGIRAAADIPSEICANGGTSPLHLETLYQEINTHWYRTTIDEDWQDTKCARVDLCRFFDERQVVLTAPIGWIRLTESGTFNYYNSLADIETNNYEHPDIAETVLKLSLIHEAALEKLNMIWQNLPTSRQSNQLFAR